jgi:hypothetical protein
MYQLLVLIVREGLALRQAPAFILSFLVATLFYRFHSFALETGAFLGTWFLVDLVIELAARANFTRRKSVVQ